jgi:predicted nucleic acid-binding protein
MIAADTSVWIDYAKGVPSIGSKHLEHSLNEGNLVMPLPVLFEVLSGPGITTRARDLIAMLPRLELLDGFWERAAELRKSFLKKGLKARSMDCLIAQVCIDHGVPLIAADQDYRHFIKHGLKRV